MAGTSPNSPALKTAELGDYSNDGFENDTIGFENDTIDGDLHDDNSDCAVKETSYKHLEEIREIGAREENGYSAKPIRLGSATGSSFTDSKRASIERSPGFKTDRCIDWLVVLASFFTHFIVGGILYSFGVFYITLLKEFEESKSATSWVGSIQIALSWIMGPIASSLSDKIGHRAVGVIGSVLAATGIGLSSLAPNVYLLYATYGVISGIGFGLIFFPSIVSVQGHFEKRKSLAMGIAVCGSGVGTFSVAPLMEFLIENISWRYALLVLAGCLLLGIGLSMLFVPSDLINKAENETEQTLSGIEKTAMFFTNLFHISLLRRVDVVVWLVCNLIIQIGFVVPHTYIPDKAVDMGIEVKNAAFLMSIVGIANTVGRVVMGLFADFRCANRRYMVGTSVIIAGVMVAILPFMNEYGVIATMCTFYGLSFGTFFALSPVFLRDLVGIENFGPSFGLTMLATGLGCLLLSAGGSLYDLTGSYDVTFYITGSLLFVAGGTLLLLPWIRELQGRCCYYGSADITTETEPSLYGKCQCAFTRRSAEILDCC